MNKKGQSVFSEYVMIFFVVIAAAVALTTFVQRGFESRIHDARNYMINAVNNNLVCDANCLNATGSSRISYEYEPYYSQYQATVQTYENDATGLMPGNAQLTGSKYYKVVNSQTGSVSASNQLPPECAAPNPPLYCGNGHLNEGN